MAIFLHKMIQKNFSEAHDQVTLESLNKVTFLKNIKEAKKSLKNKETPGNDSIKNNLLI